MVGFMALQCVNEREIDCILKRSDMIKRYRNPAHLPNPAERTRPKRDV